MNLNYFFLIYTLTIVLTRVFLWVHPMHGKKIGNFQPHHYMHGLILIAVYFFIPKITILAIGVGLVVDEIPLFFMFRGFNWPDDHWKQYHSKTSVISIAIISVVGYFVLRYI